MLPGLGNVSQVLVLLLLLVAIHTCSLFNKVPEADSHFVRERSKRTQKGGNILHLRQ